MPSNDDAARAALEDVLATEDLQRRPARAPDHARENRALAELARAMADAPEHILERLVQVAMEACEAGSAGISLLIDDDGRRSFYWPAIAGAWKPNVGGGLPYDASPCGVVVDRRAVQLFRQPERHYEYAAPIEHPIEEALLAPFDVDGATLGTVWVVSHEASRRFDWEDARLLESLSRFAAAAHRMWKAARAEEQLQRSRETFASLIAHSPFGVLVVDSRFRIRHANPGAQAVLRNAQPIVGLDFDDVLRVIWREEYACEIAARFRHTLATGESYVAPNTSEERRDTAEEESYDWRLERITLPDGQHGVVCYFYDLSVVRRAQRELRHRGEQLQTLINQAPLGVYLVDAEFRLAQVNPVAAPVFPDLPDLIGRDFGEILRIMWSAARAEQIAGVFRHTLASGEPFHAPEFEEQRADRRVPEYYDWRIERIVLPDGRHGVVCYFMDISEQVRARQAIAESEARYRTLFDAMDEGFCVLQMIFDRDDRPADYRFVETNPAFVQHTGLENAVGRSVRELVPDIEPSWLDIYGRVALTGEPIRFEEHSVSMGRWFDVYALRVGDPGERKVAVLFRNITARKAVEAALRKSEERLRIAKAAAKLGLHVFDIPAGTVEWDERTREFFGVDPDVPITYELWRAAVHPEDRASAEAAVRRATDPAGDGRYFAQYRVTSRRDGVTRWIEATGDVTFADGAPVRMVGTAQDITQRKNAEDALREADRRKDEFLATLAHELRNPMAAIRMALGVLGRADASAAQVEQMKAVIERQFAQLVRLIDDLLDVSRITRGRIELHKSRVDLGVVVSHALEGIRESCEAKGIAFEIALPEQPVHVRADPFRFAQVVSNLLSNACKFTDRGGAIGLAVGREGGDAVVRVRDTGMGIPGEFLPHIFDMFAQVEGTEGRSGGLGIGLALARSIVSMHGGSIEAFSEGRGKGSEFVVRVPALAVDVPARDMPSGPDAGVPPQERRAARILVVDDNRDALEAVAAVLRLEGHVVEVAQDGEQALEKAAAMRPEVVLLDIGLPGIDGYETARRLRCEPWGAEVRLVAMTGWGQDKDKQQAAEAGFDVHMTKPVDPERLERLLSERARASNGPRAAEATAR